MNVRQDIKDFIVSTYLFGEEGGLEDDSSFLKEGIVDSTGIMQLVSFLQERYRIAIADDELTPENLDSIGKVVAFVEKKIHAAQAPSAQSQPSETADLS